jgi:hypothetical protein
MQASPDELISAQLTHKELFSQFKQIEKLNKEDKHQIKTFIDAFLIKRKVQQLVH